MPRCLLLLVLAAPLAAADPPAGVVARLGSDRFALWGHKRVFLPGDGRTVLALTDSTLRAWDVDSGKVLWEWTDPAVFDRPADLSPDGTRLAVVLPTWTNNGAGIIVRVYDVAKRVPVWSLLPDTRALSGHIVRFTPDGRHLITAAASDMWVWDAATGKQLARHTFPDTAQTLDVSPDGTTLVTSYPVCVWAWATEAKPRPLADVRKPATNVQFAPDGKSVFVCPGTVRPAARYDVATGRPLDPFDFGGRPGLITPGPDGRTVAVSYIHPVAPEPRGGTLVLWDLATGKPGPELGAARNRVGGGRWSRDGSRFAAGSVSRVFVWDVKTGRELGAEGPRHTRTIKDLAFGPDGRAYTASWDGTVRVWDARTGRHLKALEQAGPTMGLAVSPDGGLLAGSALENDTRVWDTKTWAVVHKLTGHGRPGGKRHVRFSADEQTLLAYGDDFRLRAWDVLTGKLKSEHKVRPPLPPGFAGQDVDDEQARGVIDETAVALGPDGNTLVKGVGKEVVVYAADTGKEKFRFEADPTVVDLLALSPDGRRLATTGPGAVVDEDHPRAKEIQVTVWDLGEAKPVVRFRVAGGSYADVLAFTPDGKRVATNPRDQTLRFFDATNGKPAGTLTLPAEPDAIAFDGGGRVGVALRDTTVLIYDVAAALKPVKK